jgi:putative transposase
VGRPVRAAIGGLIVHTLNRTAAGLANSEIPADFDAFEPIKADALSRSAMRHLAYGLMPNRSRLSIWPRGDGDFSDFMRWLMMTHSQRWHAYHHDAGLGHQYEGRFKSFPVQSDDHLLAVLPAPQAICAEGGVGSPDRGTAMTGKSLGKPPC